MLHGIAKILRQSLSGLTWIERFGGLVVPATRTIYGKLDDGTDVAIGTETWPVGCGVSFDDCFKANGYSFFQPDASRASIAFFVDEGGVSLLRTEGAKESFLVFSFSLRLLVWLNGQKLNEVYLTEVDGGHYETMGGLPYLLFEGRHGCGLSGIVAPYIMARLMGRHDKSAAFTDSELEQALFQYVTVKNVRLLQKSPAVFAPFTFAERGIERGLFLAPFDYFAVGIQGEFLISRNCLPEYEEPGTPLFKDSFCF